MSSTHPGPEHTERAGSAGRLLLALVLWLHLASLPGARAPTSLRTEGEPGNLVVLVWDGPVPAPERRATLTPRLDAFLESAARFPHALAACDRGLPTEAVLMTGLVPHQSHVYAQMGGRGLDPASALGSLLAPRGQAGLYLGRFRLGDPNAFGFERDMRKRTEDEEATLAGFLQEFAGRRPLFLWWAPESGDVADLDARLGALLDALDAHGLRKDTLFALVANDQPRGKEFSARECSQTRLETPLALAWEGHLEPGTHDERVGLSDLFPTLLDYEGIVPPNAGSPSAAGGHSLRPLLEGSPWEERPLCAEFFARDAGPVRGSRDGSPDPVALVRVEGRWKYSLFFEDVGVKIDHATELVQIDRSAGDQVLVDLEADPEEEHDLFSSQEHAERLTAMREATLEWWRSTGGPELQLPFLPPRLGPPPAGSRPNIVLIVADDMDYDHLGFMGNPRTKTPTIDELAHEGVVFPVAWVPMSRCRPSLATLLSGRWPQQTGIYENSGTHTLGRRDSLPNLLKAAGYATFLGGKFWEGSHLSMGFLEPQKMDTVFQVFVRENQDELFEFIDRYHAERPFFVWWAPMLPHGPFNPPERHRAPFRETAIPVPDTIVGDAREYQEAERTAYAMDAWLDEGLAALRAKLEQTGELEDTLFVFLIDNGYVNGAPSKGTVFEKGLRTPVFFTWPKGIHGGSTRPELVYSIDLYRTILEYAGVTPPETAGGASLKPLLDGKSEEWRDALYGAAYFYKDRPGQRRVENAVYALYARTERWKFVLYLRNLDPVNFLFFHEFADFPARQRGDRDLFDLQADPGERHNLAADSSHAELMDELQRGCLEWWKATGGGELELPGDEPQGPARKRGKNR